MSSPQVGDVLTIAEQLDACPTGTILKSDGRVASRSTSHMWPWSKVGTASAFSHEGLLGDARRGEWEVIWVPAPTKAETTIDRWQIGTELVWFPHTRELVDLLHSVPITGRVRVTVERIGDDDV